MRVGGEFLLGTFFDVFRICGCYLVQTSRTLAVEFVALLELVAACSDGIGGVNIRDEDLIALGDRFYGSDVAFSFVKGVASVGVAVVIEASSAWMEVYTASFAKGACQSERICTQLHSSVSMLKPCVR